MSEHIETAARESLRHALWDFPINGMTLAELDAKADRGEGDYDETRQYLDAQTDAVLAWQAAQPRTVSAAEVLACPECGHSFAPARVVMLAGCHCDCHMEAGEVR